MKLTLEDLFRKRCSATLDTIQLLKEPACTQNRGSDVARSCFCAACVYGTDLAKYCKAKLVQMLSKTCIGSEVASKDLCCWGSISSQGLCYVFSHHVSKNVLLIKDPYTVLNVSSSSEESLHTRFHWQHACQ